MQVRISGADTRLLMWQTWRKKRPQPAPFPSEWRRILHERCPFSSRLPAADLPDLEGSIQIFLAGKRFEGCAGLAITDDIRVCVAAHACLLALHLPTEPYARLRSILVYPNGYVGPGYRHVGSGVWEEFPQPRSGESWPEGAVVLAWDVLCANMLTPDAGFNVALHEFAHQLDFEDGHADGVPLLGGGKSLAERRTRRAAWVRVMRAEFSRLQAQVHRGEETVLRDYGATNGAEFFAVATECFFGKPQALQREHPELYAEMKWYYQQDPATWAGVG